MWYSLSTVTTAALMLMISRSIHGMDWMDSSESSSANFDSIFDGSDQYLTALARDQEHEMHSPFITGYKYVSGQLNVVKIDHNNIFMIFVGLGGAGEGRQHLSPSGDIPNKPEVKTDEELPSYCAPPNPCPLGYEGNKSD